MNIDTLYMKNEALRPIVYIEENPPVVGAFDVEKLAADMRNDFDKYKKIVETEPEKAVDYTLALLNSGHNDLGIKLAEGITILHGWDYFFNETICSSKKHNYDHSIIVSNVKECMYKLATPNSLPIEKIESLLAFTENDVEWINLKSYIDFRKEIESTEGLGCGELERIAYAEDIPFWDIDKVTMEVEKIIVENPEEYYGLLREIHESIADNWGHKEATEYTDRYQEMFLDDFLKEIYPVYSFNILDKYLTKEEIKDNFILREADFRAVMKEAIGKNPKVFFHAQFLKEIIGKSAFLIGDNFDKYDIVPLLGHFAEYEGKKENEEKFGYALNSTIMPIAQETLTLYSPTGRLLTVLEEQNQNAKFQNSERIMHIAHFLSHRNVLGERQRSAYDLAFAACLCHWEIVPNEIKRKLEEGFNQCNVDLDDLIKMGRNATFDDIIDVASQYQPVLYASLWKDINEFISSELKKRTEEMDSLHLLSPEELLAETDKEYGKSRLDAGGIVQSLQSMNFESIRYLKENLDFDLSLITRREFFSLISFLENQKNGEGFLKLKKFVGDIDDQKSKANRIKTFLALQSGDMSGDQIIGISNALKYNYPENQADKIFAEYARMVDEMRESVEEISRIYSEIFFDKRADGNQVSRGIFRKANRLLAQANKRLVTASAYSKEDIVDELIAELKIQEKINKGTIESLKSLAEELNSQYRGIGEDIIGKETVEQMKEQEENWSKEYDEETVRRMKDEQTKHRKFDSHRLRENIAGYKDLYIVTDEQEKVLREIGETDESIERLKREYETNERPQYEPKVKKLEQLLSLQTNLEDKLDELIFGYSMPILPLELGPESVEQINGAYSEAAEAAEKQTEIIIGVYEKTFHEKKIDYDEVYGAIIEQAKEVIQADIKKFEDRDTPSEEDLVSQIIRDLKQRKRIQDAMLNGLPAAALELNQLYIKIYDKCLMNMEAVDREVTKKEMRQKGKSKREIAEYLSYSGIEYDLMNDPTSWYAIGEAHEQAETAMKEARHYRYDAQRVQNNIDYFESLYAPNEKGDSRMLTSLKVLRKQGLDKQGVQSARNKEIKKLEKMFRPLVNELKDLLKFQEELERKLGQAVYGETGKSEESLEKGETAGLIFGKFQEIIDQAKIAAKEKISLLRTGEMELSDYQINSAVDGLLQKANQFLQAQTQKIAEGENVSEEAVKDELGKINSKVLLLEQIIKQLPREEVSDLDLREIADIEKIEDLPAKELLKDKKLLNKILPIIDDQFPFDDRYVFLKECHEKADLGFTITMANNEIISFFSKERLPSGIIYLDWFMSNRDAPIKGLGEATAKLGFYGAGKEKERFYAVAKPHVKSFELLLEKFGFVAFSGSTIDKEYQHHYSRCRRLPEDGGLMSKRLTKEKEKELQKILAQICQEPNELQLLAFEGRGLKACLVEYGNVSYRDDVCKEDKEGYIMREIDKQADKGYVLSRFMPVHSEKDNHSFYAVFEKSQATLEGENILRAAIGHHSTEGGSKPQDDSKKALSK